MALRDILLWREYQLTLPEIPLRPFVEDRKRGLWICGRGPIASTALPPDLFPNGPRGMEHDTFSLVSMMETALAALSSLLALLTWKNSMDVASNGNTIMQ